MVLKQKSLHRHFQFLSENPFTYEFIAGFLAFTMYIPEQVASVSSRHLAVAFNIPKETTGIYFSKLFSLRALVLLLGSLAVYIFKWFISDDNIFFTLLFFTLLVISRFIILVLFYFCKNLALGFYNIFIIEALFLGLFQLTFFTLTPEYVSLLSLCFKISKISVFLIQLSMDFTSYNSPFLMVKVHFSIIFVISFFSIFMWFFYCVNYTTFKRKSMQTHTNNEVIENPYKYSVNCTTKSKEIEFFTNEPDLEREPGFFKQLRNSISPFMMCLVSIMLKNTISPGVLPYALLDRDKCHKINMAIIPMGLLGAFAVHFLKIKVKSINEKWKWQWHLTWLFIIPCVVIFIITFAALHSDGALSRAIINSQRSVLWMAVFFFFCFAFVESLGYLGVVSIVKHNGRVYGNGLKVVSTNQFVGYVTGFLFYKISVGYNVTRSFATIPPETEDSFIRFLFWIRESINGAFRDFIKDFHMNIKEYI
ncbi:uncharacterized protein TA10640 [Theileria annulata]|uniref:Uncharacterized protein n=1 Tax=Theileria annulata TaxID=5874 RepID=Q4U927_THEAN|nr:uncharacterized protein TA10640 [Theileria annulata]CAI76676.1 hypothetical protein TA10640 [Theileria annulata]|eukprot:XP_953301.1 hypothetical protein TA10640 [Theileria annulata]